MSSHQFADYRNLAGAEKRVEDEVAFITRVHENLLYQLRGEFCGRFLISVPVLTLDVPNVFFVLVVKALTSCTVRVLSETRIGMELALFVGFAHVQAVVNAR